jgi:hypothetical protein
MNTEGHTFAQCDTVVVQVTGAGAAGGIMTAAATPAGELWEVLYADAYHNDVGALGATWYYDDLVTKIQLGDIHAALAPATRTILATESKIAGSIYLGNGHHLSIETGVGAGAGKQWVLSMLVRKVRGVL